MNSTIRVISGDWNILPVGDIKNNWSYFRLEIIFSFEINVIADDNICAKTGNISTEQLDISMLLEVPYLSTK